MIKKLNSLTILFIVTAVMVILMLITIQSPSENTDEYGVLFPDLAPKLSAIDTMTFTSQQDNFTLYKKDGEWLIRERWDHPADFNLVKRTLLDMSTAKILERKTNKPEQYDILGVEGSADGGGSVEIALSENDEVLAGLILGHEREVGQTGGPRQFYVRRSGEGDSWLVEGYLNLSPLMLNWIKSEVINIARERIASVSIIQPSGQAAHLINLGQKDKFGTPEDREKTIFKYEQLGYDIAGTLFQLRMEDVKPASDFSRGNAEVVTAEFITFDGLKVITKTSFNDGVYYSTLSAEYDAAAVRHAPEDIQKLNVLKTAEQVQQEVALLNKQLSPWVYRFGGFVGTNLMRAKADMVTTVERVIPMPADLTGGAQ